MKTLIATSLLTFSFAVLAAPFTIEGTVTRVSDGDTLHIVDAALEDHTVRMAHIDAPESKQLHGTGSKNSLTALSLNKRASATCYNQDQYGRNVCTVFVSGVDVNAMQVRRGLAWVYTDYAPKNTPLRAIEDAARTAKIGLWKSTNPVQPWVWRRKNR